MTNILPLNKETHINLKIKQDKTYIHAKNQHISILQVHEFVAAASCYPIVFLKDADTGEFRSAALFGLQPHENLFYSDSHWQAHYVPASIKGYPFLIAPETSSVCVDMSNERLNETDGIALFNADGSESDYLKNIKENLSIFVSQTPVTREFIRYLAEKNLLSPLTLTINTGSTEGDGYKLNGLYAIENKKFNSLSDQEFIELRHKNYLPAIYAHIMSLSTMGSLIQKKTDQQNL